MNGGKKKMLIFGGLSGIVVLLLALIYFYKTQTDWIESPAYKRKSTSKTQTLVVVYSRTGNTLSTAKESARFFDADLLQIEAPQYARTLKGQFLAAKDADEELTTTTITHEAVEISDYDLIVLCSPTWWFRPAPPLWSFVENHDFAGKSVFLLMTGNSRLKDEFTEKFKNLVEKQNGIFTGNLFAQRGRIYWQKSPEKLNAEVIESFRENKHLMANQK